MKLIKIVDMLFFFILIPACIVMGQDKGIVFTNVNVIPMTEAGLILKDQSVVVKEGIIQKIGDREDIEIPADANVIDGKNNYLIPGLAEMHAHIPSKSQGNDRIEETLFLYLSNGITTIRGMLGEAYHLELKEKIVKREITGPRIYTSGPSLNGNTVKTELEARNKVVDQKKAGYDFLKLHPGINLEVFDEIVKTSNEVGISFAGHVSIDVGIRHALNSGYASIDHVDGYVEGLVPKGVEVNPNENGFFGMNFTDLADWSMIHELSLMTKENNVWVVPTQSLIERWVGLADAEELAMDDEMKYMSRSTVERWVATKKSFTSTASYSKALAQRFIELRREIIKDLHDSGVGILLGSDAPQVFNVPGFSIQNELESMVNCGLSPYEALKTGTANPAEFFGAKGEYGTIVAGASADFILVEGNPLDDITNARNQRGVMVRGEWLSEMDIQEKLLAIAQKYAR